MDGCLSAILNNTGTDISKCLQPQRSLSQHYVSEVSFATTENQSVVVVVVAVVVVVVVVVLAEQRRSSSMREVSVTAAAICCHRCSSRIRRQVE